MLRSAAAPVSVVTELALTVPEVLPSRVLRTEAARDGVGEGDGLISELADAGGAVGGVEVCGSARERGDGVRVNGAFGFAVEGVEDRCGERGIGEGDGLVAKPGDARRVVGGVEICCLAGQRVDRELASTVEVLSRVLRTLLRRGMYCERKIFITKT